MVHVLAERGVLDYDTPIVELWPEFGAHGKESATVRHALSQSVGVPGLPPGLTVEDLCDWQKMCAIIADAEPGGSRAPRSAITPYTFGYIVGEIVRRASGKPISQVLREEVAGPLGVADELFFAVPQPSRAGWPGWRTPKAARRCSPRCPRTRRAQAGTSKCTTAAYGNRTDVLSANIPAGGTDDRPCRGAHVRRAAGRSGRRAA